MKNNEEKKKKQRGGGRGKEKREGRREVTEKDMGGTKVSREK